MCELFKYVTLTGFLIYLVSHLILSPMLIARLYRLVKKIRNYTIKVLTKSRCKMISQSVACENMRFSSLFATGDVSRGGTSATQRQKFHTDDVNQFLYNKSGSHGIPNINLTNFTCFLVDVGKVLCSSANELQQNSNASSREDYIPQILAVLFEILRVYI